MNPDIYDDNSKGQKIVKNEAYEPREFSKEDLIKMKQRIKDGMENIQADMDWNDVVKAYVNGTDDFRQEILDILKESVKVHNLPEEEYLKRAEYLEMRRKLETRVK